MVNDKKTTKSSRKMKWNCIKRNMKEGIEKKIKIKWIEMNVTKEKKFPEGRCNSDLCIFVVSLG